MHMHIYAYIHIYIYIYIYIYICKDIKKIYKLTIEIIDGLILYVQQNCIVIVDNMSFDDDK